MNFVHSAPEMPLTDDLDYFGRWKMATRHLASQSAIASHVCIVTDADGTQIWRVGPGAGYCLAASIENWLQENPEIQDALVVIPLDRRTYLAEVEFGLIVREVALVHSRAVEEMEAPTKYKTLLIFDAGGLGNQHLRPFGELVKVPFNLKKFSYEWAPLVFLKQGMVHRVHVFFAASLVVASLGWYWFEPAEEAVIQVAEVVTQKPLAAPQADFSAAEQIEQFVQTIDYPLLKALVSDRLSSIVFQDGQLIARGNLADSWPARVVAMSEHRPDGQFSLNSEGWQLKLPLPVKPDRRPLSEHSYLPAVQSLFAAARAARARIKLSGNFTDERTSASTFEVTLDKPPQTALHLLAKNLANQPVEFGRLNCEYNRYQVQSCRLVLTVKGKP